MRVIVLTSLFFSILVFAFAQEDMVSNGIIPDELLMPRRGESPRYPIDTVIGELGQGRASADAYSFANSVAAGLFSGAAGHPNLASVNVLLKESYLSALEKIDPRSFRLGGGKKEPDGAVSFMVRFIGREQGITGELFIKFVPAYTLQVEEESEDEEAGAAEEKGSWVFDDLILDEAKSNDVLQKESLQRFDFSPYERFF